MNTIKNVHSPAGTQEPKREAKEWWAVCDKAVHKVTGYSCAPQNPKTWWCPEVGYSLHEEYHLFPTEAAAINHLICDVEKEIKGLLSKTAKLKDRLAVL